MWSQYAPQVGIDTGLHPYAASATGDEQRAVAAAIYNQYGFTPFVTAHPGIAARLPTNIPQPQSVPIWGSGNYLSTLQSTPEGNFFDPFGVGRSDIPSTAIGTVGSNPGLSLAYEGGTKITPGSTLTGNIPTTGPTQLGAGGGGTLGSIGGSDPFANIPSAYSEPSTGVDTSAPASGGLSQLAANYISPLVNWASAHLVITGIILISVGGFAAYHGLLGAKFETFVKRFV
jgi:hypothetical protein